MSDAAKSTRDPETDAMVERLERLLDQAIAAARAGDGAAAILLLQEVHATALKLPHKTSRGLINLDARCRLTSDESGLRGECLRCGAEQGKPCPENIV